MRKGQRYFGFEERTGVKSQDTGSGGGVESHGLGTGGLPITPLLPEIVGALSGARSAVLVAPPGAGKTTAVPLALLHAPWLSGRKILLLEPRRLAARNAAWRMAALLGEPEPGGTVGYRIRHEVRVGPRTRIEVVTEGILTRMIQEDPSLEGVGVVLFDEFHERSLDAEVGLALTLEARDLFTPDLRVLVLSATLDPEPVAALLRSPGEGEVPILRSEGRMYPVRTEWRSPPRAPNGRSGGRAGTGAGAHARVIEGAVASTVVEALAETEGDVLVFLPGAGEIHRVRLALEAREIKGVHLALLHGSLTRDEQDAALRPAPLGVRKVILASAVAETSLTIEGVRVVIDSGLMRVPRFDPGSGLTRLRTLRVSRDAADQRRGRAGRTAPGWCYRVWSEAEERGLVPHRTPEILEADLAPLLIEAARWGAPATELRWLTPPPEGALAAARELLEELGSLAPDGTLTPSGHAMAQLGTHPRLARVLLSADDLGVPALGCALAALLEDRDPFLREGGVLADADLRLRLEALDRGSAPIAGIRVDRAALERARTQTKVFARRLRVPMSSERGGPVSGRQLTPVAMQVDEAGILAAQGWPDRIAQHRGGGRYVLANGRGAILEGAQTLLGTPWIVAIEVDDRGGESRILQAVPLDLADLEARFPAAFRTTSVTRWNRELERVEAVQLRSLGSLEVARSAIPQPDPEAVAEALAEGVRTAGITCLPWTDGVRQLRDRIQFMRRDDVDGAEGGWPDVSDEGLMTSVERWLHPFCQGVRSLDALRKTVDLSEALLAGVSWEARGRLDAWAPQHVQVPSGSRIRIDYEDSQAPVLAARLQELFGMRETPRIAGGRVSLTVHILSPARRPVQVTRDLENFWRETYFEVKKDLKGRYPKHFWPEDPLTAPATRRVRPPGSPPS